MSSIRRSRHFFTYERDLPMADRISFVGSRTLTLLALIWLFPVTVPLYYIWKKWPVMSFQFKLLATVFVLVMLVGLGMITSFLLFAASPIGQWVQNNLYRLWN